MLKRLESGTTPTTLPDIKPQTPVSALDRTGYADKDQTFDLDDVAPIVGMSPTFIAKVLGRRTRLSVSDVITLLDQDSFGETFLPRSRVVGYLLERREAARDQAIEFDRFVLFRANALDVIRRMPSISIECVVTSTPYWAMRIYRDSQNVSWADGEVCPYGHEQTPEGFVRHTAEILFELSRIVKNDGSIWWNVMDSFNTRTQIRGNAAEALRAMQGKDARGWGDHEARRYSAGHVYLKDGEQCLIPSRIAERASRMGLFVKTMITWAKTSSLPEPQLTRVSRNLEYVIHLSKTRSPAFFKDEYRSQPAALGGRNGEHETDKLSDVWTLPTSSGRDGHGAQFPIALPARCIALSTRPSDVVFDPFVGAGNSGVAALRLGRRFIGCDISEQYLATAERKLSAVAASIP